MSTAPAVGIAVDRALAEASSEAALVAELRAGSEEAYAYILAVYQNPVYNLIWHIVEEGADAADVLQDVFLKVFRGIRGFHGQSSLKTWIYRIAVHEATNHRRSWLRRRLREVFSLDGDLAPQARHLAAPREEAPDRAFEQAEQQELVRRALSSLPQPYRTVVVLREMEGLTYEEIARMLGIAEGTVKSRLMRGRELLKQKLEGALRRQDV